MSKQAQYCENNGPRQLTQTESIVFAIWAEVLQIDKISPEDNFFGLGGDSLMAMVALFRVNDELHLDLPQGSIYKSPTLAEFSDLIDNSLAASEQQAQPYESPTDFIT